MQLHSSQQDDDAPVKDKPLPAAKQQPMAFTAPPESLKRKQVTAAQPAGPPPDVAQPAPAPAPSPELAQEPAQTPAPAPAPAPVASRQLPPADEQGGSPREAALREEIRKRDRDIETLQDAVSKLKQQLAASKTAQQRMSKVVDLHMLSLARLASSRGGEPQQAPDVRRLTSERDEAREEVANIEAMFADLHRKYEKSKALVAENKQTSELVAVELDQALAQVSREQQRYDMLQQYAEDTMHRLQSDMVLEQKSQETEALRMSARLQLAENRATKLERENQEVTAICDELIQKMGDR
ncbi:transforming acidic coiled-coil-containing protein 3-like [Pollicipes pollicipes]|uniref:transforming acidic coiled-coil-containing protein 3-like n=1 Tax=Pollicipes pollicipes TaxID=41117 RepID=UPI001884C013|nr:transforming acidic coiled-coil-containing protein 3-like [Pollicipes pollicipes]